MHALRTTLSLLVLSAAAAAQIASGHHLVLTELPPGSSTLLDVDTGSGTVRALPGFSLDTNPPLACTWDPVARHAVVAVATAAGSAIARIDPRGGFERPLTPLADPVVAMELDVDADLLVLTGGANGAIWHLPRNGGTPSLRIATPWATAWGMAKRSIVAWVAQAPPTGPPTLTLVDPQLGSVLVPPTPFPALAGARITGVFELPTGAIRHVLCDDNGGIHLLEFFSNLRTLAVTPPLPPGATRDLMVELNYNIEVVVLGDGRFPFLHRVPVFGGPPTATRLAGPLPGSPVDLDLVDSAAGWGFGSHCGASFGAMSFLALPGTTGFLEVRTGPRNAAALGVFGTSEQLYGATLLPLALPAGGCPLLVAPEVVVPVTTDPTGTARVSFPVPAVLPRGLAVYAQWVFPGATAIATSPGLSTMTEP